MADLNITELRRWRKDYQFLEDHALRIGWISDPIDSPTNREGKDSKMKSGKGIVTPKTVGEVARAHELGHGVPQRSMLADTMLFKEREIFRGQAEILGAVIKGKITSAQGLALLGEVVLGLIRDRMVAGIKPGLAKSTKRWKARQTQAGMRKDTALIRWGIMINSIRYKIVRR